MWGQFIDIEEEYFLKTTSLSTFRLSHLYQNPGSIRRIKTSGESLSEIDEINQEHLEAPVGQPLPECNNDSSDDVSSEEEVFGFEEDLDLEDELYESENEEERNISDVYQEEENDSSDVEESKSDESKIIDNSRKNNLNNICCSLKKICWSNGRRGVRRKLRNKRNTSVLPDCEKYHWHHSWKEPARSSLQMNTQWNERDLCQEFTSSTQLINSHTHMNSSENVNQTGGIALSCKTPKICARVVALRNQGVHSGNKLCDVCTRLPRCLEFAINVKDNTLGRKMDECRGQNIVETKHLFLSVAEAVALLIASHPQAMEREDIALKLKEQFLAADKEKQKKVISTLNPSNVVSSLSWLRCQEIRRFHSS